MANNLRIYYCVISHSNLVVNLFSLLGYVLRCLYPKQVNTAEPIESKICVAIRMTWGRLTGNVTCRTFISRKKYQNFLFLKTYTNLNKTFRENFRTSKNGDLACLLLCLFRPNG